MEKESAWKKNKDYTVITDDVCESVLDSLLCYSSQANLPVLGTPDQVELQQAQLLQGLGRWLQEGPS
jgi:hypothetical protein